MCPKPRRPINLLSTVGLFRNQKSLVRISAYPIGNLLEFPGVQILSGLAVMEVNEVNVHCTKCRFIMQLLWGHSDNYMV